VLPSKSLLMEGVFSLLITLWVCIYLEAGFFLNTDLVYYDTIHAKINN